jgi:precorrin-6B methylase 2
LLENAYRGSDVVKRRLATLEALAPEAGEVIVDVGSGQGYLSLELVRAVGEAGEDARAEAVLKRDAISPVTEQDRPVLSNHNQAALHMWSFRSTAARAKDCT